MIDTHSMNAEIAAAEARRLKSVPDVDAVIAHEEAHPEHHGGRKTVLSALQSRRDHLVVSEASERRRAARWTTGEWRGHTNYQCKECPYATLDRGAMVKHAATRHPRRWETGTPEPGPLSGVDFASDEASELASELGLTSAELGRITPTGKSGGYTVADVRAAASTERS